METFFVPFQPVDYLSPHKITSMKKMIFVAALALSLVACQKENLPAAQANPATQAYFSRVRDFSDGRPTDTIWTLRLTTPDMVNTYRQLDGYQYESTPVYTIRGKFWEGRP